MSLITLPVPILMTTYRRLAHVQRSIVALQRNPLAQESVLYVTSDGPCPGDEQQVQAVRNFLKGVGGFKEIHLLFRDTNQRLENRRVLRELLERYGVLICLEEDCETAPGFLEFLNAALERYRNDPRIFSISGYLPPLKTPAQCGGRSYLIPRFNAWGFGIWADRHARVAEKIRREEYAALLRSRQFQHAVLHKTGTNLVKMLKLIAEGKMMAYDAMASLEMIRSELYSVYPAQSLVQNRGIDGTGLHCGNNRRFDTLLCQGALPEGSDALLAPAVIRETARFYSDGLRGEWKYRWGWVRGKYRLSPPTQV